MTLTLLVDLDDTLLPDSSSKFIPAYLAMLGNHLNSLAPAESIIQTLYSALQHALEYPRLSATIKENFDQSFYPALGTTYEEQADRLVEFYSTRYRTLSPITAPDPEVVKFIENAIADGYKIAIATNPIFPEIATRERLHWAGLPPEDYPFEIITSYEHFHFGKPHPAYYLELIAQLGWPESGYAVIGNDLKLDITPARNLGIPAFWVTPNQPTTEIEPSYGKGSISEALPWLEAFREAASQPDWNGYTTSLYRLQANPAALDTLIRKASESIWTFQPGSADWGLTEIVCHLRDVDREVHLPRLDTIETEANPFIPAVNPDAWAEERQYNRQNGPIAFQDFLQAREEFISRAAALPEVIREKAIRHTIFGPTTLEEIMQISTRHDTLHLQQAFDLLKAENRSV